MQPRDRGRGAAAGRRAPVPHARFSISGDGGSDSSTSGFGSLMPGTHVPGAAVTPTAESRGLPAPVRGRRRGGNLFAQMLHDNQSGRRGGAATEAAAANAADSSWGSPRIAGAANGAGGQLLFEPLGRGGGGARSSLLGSMDSPLAGPSRRAPVLAPSGLNPDGSFSVVGDEAEADGSGLMHLSPAFARKPMLKSGRSHLNDVHLHDPGATAAAGARNARGAKGKGKSTADAQMEQHRAADESEAGSVVIHDGDSDEVDAAALPASERAELLSIMRYWRDDAQKHLLFDTAIFWGDKILSLETEQTLYNDAFNLAMAYFLSHRYAQAEHLLTTPIRIPAPIVPAASQPAPSSDDALAQAAAAGGGKAAQRTVDEADPLSAALQASRKGSVLPPSFLARSERSGYQGGVLPPPSQEGWPNGGGEGATYADAEAGEAAGAGVKRKERGFTVSGTGTGSEASASAPSSGGSLGKELEEDAANAHDAPLDLFDGAWLMEHRVAVEELRDREKPAPDGEALISWSSGARWLAAQCMARQKKYHKALELLDDREEKAGDTTPSLDGGIKLGSGKWHLRGQILLHLDDKEKAKQCFMKALALDVRNYDAFSALVEGRLLGADEQWSFVQGLEYLAQAGSKAGNKEAFLLVKMCYTTRLDKEGQAHALQASAARRHLVAEYGMSDNADVLLGLAEELYARLRFSDAHVVTKRILEITLDHEATLPIHIATMFHLPHLRPALFLLAHHLTDSDPDLPAAWYAVGMWYACAERWAEARRFFSKSVNLDPRFSPGWIAFAHTFAFEGESDQAITSYSTAARQFPQSHLPKLFIAMEHIHQGNMTLASLFLEASMKLWEEDPLAYNEKGVIEYAAGRWGEAIKCFTKALKLAGETQQPATLWAPTHLNLGFAYRRDGDDDAAMVHLRRVLELDPHCASAFVGLGMASHRKGIIHDAIGFYHSALAIDPRVTLTQDLLNLALQESALKPPLEHPATSATGLGTLDETEYETELRRPSQELTISMSHEEESHTEDEASFSHSSAAAPGDSFRENDDEEEMDMSLSGAM